MKCIGEQCDHKQEKEQKSRCIGVVVSRHSSVTMMRRDVETEAVNRCLSGVGVWAGTKSMYSILYTTSSSVCVVSRYLMRATIIHPAKRKMERHCKLVKEDSIMQQVQSSSILYHHTSRDLTSCSQYGVQVPYFVDGDSGLKMVGAFTTVYVQLILISL